MYIKESDGWRGTDLVVSNQQTGEGNVKTDQQFIKINGRWVGMPRNTFEWIERTMPFPAHWAVATVMEGKFMCIGRDPNTIAFSGDTTEWDHQTFDLEVDVSVAPEDGSAYEAVWQLFEPSLTIEFPDTQHPLLFQPGVKVAVLANSDHFDEWSHRILPFAGNWVGGCGAPNGTFVMLEGHQVNEDGSWAKTDRAICSQHGDGIFEIQLPSKQFWTAVHYSEERNYWVAVAKDSKVNATSLDGINWVEHEMPRHADWTGITFGSSLWVAIADGDVVAISSWAKGTWVESSNSSYAPWSQIKFVNDRFLAISSPHKDTVWSRDGMTWECLRLPVVQDWKTLTFMGSKFLATGMNSDVAATLDFNEYSDVVSLNFYWPFISHIDKDGNPDDYIVSEDEENLVRLRKGGIYRTLNQPIGAEFSDLTTATPMYIKENNRHVHIYDEDGNEIHVIDTDLEDSAYTSVFVENYGESYSEYDNYYGIVTDEQPIQLYSPTLSTGVIYDPVEIVNKSLWHGIFDGAIERVGDDEYHYDQLMKYRYGPHKLKYVGVSQWDNNLQSVGDDYFRFNHMHIRGDATLLTDGYYTLLVISVDGPDGIIHYGTSVDASYHQGEHVYTKWGDITPMIPSTITKWEKIYSCGDKVIGVRADRSSGPYVQILNSSEKIELEFSDSYWGGTESYNGLITHGIYDDSKTFKTNLTGELKFKLQDLALLVRDGGVTDGDHITNEGDLKNECRFFFSAEDELIAYGEIYEHREPTDPDYYASKKYVAKVECSGGVFTFIPLYQDENIPPGYDLMNFRRYGNAFEGHIQEISGDQLVIGKSVGAKLLPGDKYVEYIYDIDTRTMYAKLEHYHPET